MYEVLKLNLMLIVGMLFGPFLAIYLSFYNDVYNLSKKFTFLSYLSDEWELVLIFLLFWMGIYFFLSFWSALRRFINKPARLEWWQTETIYQIYVKSFYDATNDGYGDLRGIAQKLDYIQELGAKTIWLNPIYPSGGKDGGYDIVSFVDIDPVYGTLRDFDQLVEQIHQRGMHLLMDFIPNHTSNLHDWFIESCKDEPDNPYRDYYVWYPSEDKVNPPNNWKSCFGGPAWTYVESRQAWYLHQFLAQQPDLNLRCPRVRDELENVIKYWLEERNVDGFRVDAVKHLFESEGFENEPLTDASKFKSIHDKNIVYNDLDHLYTANRPETYRLLSDWRGLFDAISRKTDRRRALIVEATYDVEDIGGYYYHENKPNAHFAFNFQMCFVNEREKLWRKTQFVDVNANNLEQPVFRPASLKALVEEYFRYLPRNCWPNWQLGNHDNNRVASRIGADNVNLANVLNLLLGGTAIVYYGEEIGMEDLPREMLTFEDCQDERGKYQGPSKYLDYTRDLERTPMHWSSKKNAGFSAANKTWLPIHPNYKHVNVENQLNDKQSSLNVFKQVLKLREQVTFQCGTVKVLTANEQTLSFLRKAFGCDVYLIVMNLSDSLATVNLLVSNEIAPRAYVALYIPGRRETTTTSNGHHSDKDETTDLNIKYKLKSPVLTKSVTLKARDCLILTWPTSD